MLNPLAIFLGIAVFIVYGPQIFLYFAITYAVSGMIGWYAERKMLAYDSALRYRASCITGRKYPGNACATAAMVRRTAKWSGPFTGMAVPLCILVMAWFYSYRAWRLEEGLEYTSGGVPAQRVRTEMRRAMRQNIQTQTVPDAIAQCVRY